MSDLKKLINLMAPAVGAIAAGPQHHGDFWNGYQQDQQRQQQERQRQQIEDDRKAVAGSQYMVHAGEALQGIEDPVQFDELMRLYEDAGSQAGYLKPGDLKGRVTFNQGKAADARLKELSDLLSNLEKGGYDLDQLSEAGSVLQLKDKSTLPIASALEMTRKRPLDAQGRAIPKPKIVKPSDEVSLQRETVSVNGVPTFANFNPKEGKYYSIDGKELPNAQPVTNSPKPPDRSFVEAQFDDLLALWKEQHPGQEPSAAARTQTRQQAQRQIGMADNAPKAPPTGALDTKTKTRVDQTRSRFDNLPVVKNIQIQAEALSFAESMNPKTTNPADDQALIYAFAKAMDPNSVVREGEYATVQKYAQSWAESFGFNAARIFSNTTFLTPEARANMKRSIRGKYEAAKTQYDNVRHSFVDQLNKITGQGDGEEWLSDYAAGFPQGSTSGATPAAAKSARDKLMSR
jgi:hypothetical protein